jgi:hypothetical protein
VRGQSTQGADHGEVGMVGSGRHLVAKEARPN